jgi:NAD(P)H dehydrogenase (quinone)
MTRVAIVYHSGKGHTAALAEASAEGAASVAGVEVQLLQISHQDIQPDGRWKNEQTMNTIAAADAVIFGCPTYMGSVSGLFKLFLEDAFTPWFAQAWKDKFASGFTNSASQSGDKLSTILQLVVFAGQMGMMWIPLGDPPGNNWSGGSAGDVNRLGSFLGVMGQSNGDQDSTLAPPGSDRETARRHGRRVAQIAHRWAAGGAYETEYIKAM